MCATMLPRLCASLVLMLSATLAASSSAPAQATRPGSAAKVQEKAKGADAKEAKDDGRIDVNSATAEQLAKLPGVGPATAKKIIDGRPYKTLDDLSDAGVNASTLAKLKPMAVARAMPSGVNVNTASAERLQTLPGVGPALAKAIIEGRPYTTIDDLGKVKGLGEAKLDELRGRVAIADEQESKADVSKAEAKGMPAVAKAKAKAKSKSGKAVLAPGQKINLNTATHAELEALYGIGPARSKAIVEARPFKTIDDIKKIKGIGDVIFGRIKDNITVD